MAALLRSALLAFILVSVSLLHARPEDVFTVNHYSRALQKQQTFTVYVPPAAQPNEQFPVLYILHGAWGSFTDWPEKTHVLELAEQYRMVLVFPDGGQFGWYLNSKVDPANQYETYIIQELVPTIDQMYPTTHRREGRAIMGLSMGGHGAISLAAKYPDVFGSASSLSGILRLTNHPDRWHIVNLLGPMEENLHIWAQSSCYELAGSFKKRPVHLMFDCGVDDTGTGAITDGRQFHQRLLELGVPHIWREQSGSHSWEYWAEHLQDHLNFHQATTTEAIPDLSRWFRHYFTRMNEFVEENSRLPLNPATRPTVCLLGSSTMEGFPSDLLTDFQIINRGISSDTLGVNGRGVANRLELSVFDSKPDYVFILNGRNDLGNRARNGVPTLDDMVHTYDNITSEILTRLPDTRVFIMTCPSTRHSYAHLAEPTREFNDMLRLMAASYNVPVVDLYAATVAKDGMIRDDLTREGLHFNKAGYELMSKMMKDAIAKAGRIPEKKVLPTRGWNITRKGL